MTPTRFVDFRDVLGIAPNILTNRLTAMVDAGRRERTRCDYHLTPAGEDLKIVLAALQQWGAGRRRLLPPGPRKHGRPQRLALTQRSARCCAGSQLNPSGSTKSAASALSAIRCEPLPSTSTPASFASAFRPYSPSFTGPVASNSTYLRPKLRATVSP